MKFQDIKVGDTVYTQELHGLNYGWGRTAYTQPFWIALTVTKVTATQFTAGGIRFNKSGGGVGRNSYAYKSGEQYNGGMTVPSVCQSEEKRSHIKKLRVLSEVQCLCLDVHTAPDIDTALKAADLIRQAHSLLRGDV